MHALPPGLGFDGGAVRSRFGLTDGCRTVLGLMLGLKRDLLSPRSKYTTYFQRGVFQKLTMNFGAPAFMIT